MSGCVVSVFLFVSFLVCVVSSFLFLLIQFTVIQFFFFITVLDNFLHQKCLFHLQILDLGITVAFTCTMKRSMNKHLFTLSTVLVFVLPMIVITVLYVLIGLQLRRSKVVKRGTVTGSSVKLKVSQTFCINSIKTDRYPLDIGWLNRFKHYWSRKIRYLFYQ